MNTSRISSQFDMMSGKTIVLSGLLQNTSAHDAGGLAGLRRLPILGRLFDSQKFQHNKTELVIFVTPEVLNPQMSEKISLPKGMSNEL
jgi:pilus assembly protein CpaC